MRNALTCIGEYAEVPYVLEKIGTRVFCIEELCFYLCENVCLIDRGIIKRDLIEWIDRQCGLKDLARELYSLANNRASESAFVGVILEYVRFQPDEVIKQTENFLKDHADMDVFEKRKQSADYLLIGGHVEKAVAEYERLEKEIPSEEKEKLAVVYHNKAVLLSQLFMFKAAAEYFKKAYDLNGKGESYVEYLIALRLLMPQEEYLAFLSEHEESYEYSLLVEKRMKKVEEKWQKSDGMEKIRKLRDIMEADGRNGYAKETRKISRKLKERYRGLLQG